MLTAMLFCGWDVQHTVYSLCIFPSHRSSKKKCAHATEDEPRQRIAAYSHQRGSSSCRVFVFSRRGFLRAVSRIHKHPLKGSPSSHSHKDLAFSHKSTHNTFYWTFLQSAFILFHFFLWYLQQKKSPQKKGKYMVKAFGQNVKNKYGSSAHV